MAKIESSLKNMILALTGISIFAAGALGVVYNLTLEPIKTAERAKQEAAIKEVAPNFNNKPVEERYALISPEGDSLMCFPAKRDGKLTGVAIESYSKKGFHGEISVMVGLDPKGRIVNYTVLKHTETPGLGSKMADWFKTDKKKQNILGLDPGKDKVWVSKDGGDVDAITAATISSRAFLDAIDRAYRSYMASLNIDLDARTGASAKKVKDTAAVVLSPGKKLKEKTKVSTPEKKQVFIREKKATVSTSATGKIDTSKKEIDGETSATVKYEKGL